MNHLTATRPTGNFTSHFGQHPFQPAGYGQGAYQAIPGYSFLSPNVSHHHGAPQPAAPAGNDGVNGTGGNGPIEIPKGQSYTTPGGSTIDFHGNKVEVHDAGSQGTSECQPDPADTSNSCGTTYGSWAAAGCTPNGSWAAAGCGSYAPPTSDGCGDPCSPGASNVPPSNWSVHGDPHITNPDGSKGEFSHGTKGAKSNGMFTLSDGTRIVMEAHGAHGTVGKVLVFPAGAPLTGFDQHKTTNWVNDGGANGGKFVAQGTAADVPQAYQPLDVMG